MQEVEVAMVTSSDCGFICHCYCCCSVFGCVFFRDWKWTDGSSTKHLKIVHKIKNFNAINNQHNRSFCCMLTEDDKLECTNCTEEHGYICEGHPG